ASSNDISRRGLKLLAKAAAEIARNQAEVPDFPGLPGASAIAQVEAYSRETAEITPAARAAMARDVIRPAAATKSNASGVISNSESTMAVANSLGIRTSSRTSEFAASTVIENGGGSGWAGAASWTRRRVNVGNMGRRALKICLESAEPQALPPGDYPVILQPQAVAGLVSYMAYVGFGAQSLFEGRSFLSHRIGEKVMHESVSIWDDGLDGEGLPAAFDFEGVPKRRVNLIDKGVAKSVVYDTYWAAKAGIVSTGHAMPAGFSEGPLPTNLFMAPGGSSAAEMIASSERAVLVTRFHYVNIADPKQGILTGLTRDGTFLVENGAVAHPVKNLRFTENMLAAFSKVEAVSAERSLEEAMLGPALVPAVKISSFRFTGSTDL
ncbi:MAG: TldD/PmbA family protein, partial [Planctomycetes bacterium]|nr:TldD/PmbA family protein [Planctomycetota bacterium]